MKPLRIKNSILYMSQFLNQLSLNRSLIPDEAIVLIAFYKNQEHFNWILNHKLYNTRTGSGRGSIPLNSEFTKASYLLLHTKSESVTNKFYKLKVNGPRNYSKEELLGIDIQLLSIIIIWFLK